MLNSIQRTGPLKSFPIGTQVSLLPTASSSWMTSSFLGRYVFIMNILQDRIPRTDGQMARIGGLGLHIVNLNRSWL